jgi:hypothetical protein
MRCARASGRSTMKSQFDRSINPLGHGLQSNVRFTTPRSCSAIGSMTSFLRAAAEEDQLPLQELIRLGRQ